MKYQSEVLKEIIDKEGHITSLLHYQSECVETFIKDAKGCYPKLCDYEGEWLNYINTQSCIGEFPYVTLSDVTEATVNNVVPYEYKSAILKGSTKYRDIDTGEVLDVFEDGRNLELVSVQMPILTTTGSNMVNPTDIEVIGCNSYDVDSDGITNIVGDTTGYWARSYIRYTHHLKGNTTYYIYCDGDSTGTINAQEWVDNINKGGIRWNSFYKYTPKTDVLYEIRIFLSADESPFTCSKIRIGIFETTTKPSSFEPYKSNILTVNEDVTLRGIGNVKDTLDCLTGELIQRIGEVVLDGSQNVTSWWDTTSTVGVSISIPTMKNISNLVCDRLPVVYYRDINNSTYDTDGIASWDSGNIVRFRILKSKLITADIDGIISYLQSNPITVQYELVSESVKKVELSVVNQNGNKLMEIRPIEGTMHISTSSDTIQPTFSGEIPVEAITQNLSSFIKE